MDDFSDLKAKVTHTRLRAATPLKPKMPEPLRASLTLLTSVLGLGSAFIGFWILMLGVLQLIIPSLAYLAYDTNNWLWGLGFSILGLGLILTSFRLSR